MSGEGFSGSGTDCGCGVHRDHIAYVKDGQRLDLIGDILKCAWAHLSTLCWQFHGWGYVYRDTLVGFGYPSNEFYLLHCLANLESYHVLKSLLYSEMNIPVARIQS